MAEVMHVDTSNNFLKLNLQNVVVHLGLYSTTVKRLLKRLTFIILTATLCPIVRACDRAHFWYIEAKPRWRKDWEVSKRRMWNWYNETFTVENAKALWTMIAQMAVVWRYSPEYLVQEGVDQKPEPVADYG